eukprot:gnl/MRDRNA2_/MRDRNA2_37179_c0_seq1.p1 gnl/MRDRNA2_/MRDRNA2_37179_c0~~gnl/MRDRNA2_/MRDRNA2_37179_c0_seq1.p1  ORF type:complete len:239 (-),score=51.16 gnl/MRDRNA2_/MRDRNA2_37179_c0_seq1:87-803(-)
MGVPRPINMAGDDSEDEHLWGRGHGPLSHISEGSNESGTTTAFFSCTSGATRNSQKGSRANSSHKGLKVDSDHKFFTSAGHLQMPVVGKDRRSRSTESSMKDALLKKNPEFLKSIVKDFVEAGVRGRKLDALRRDGRTRQTQFRLDRNLDAFEILEEGRSSSHRISLDEISDLTLGDDMQMREEKNTELPSTLDQTCAVLDFYDGRCLVFRFPEVGDAVSFKLCMQLFTDEVRRSTTK